MSRTFGVPSPVMGTLSRRLLLGLVSGPDMGAGPWSLTSGKAGQAPAYSPERRELPARPFQRLLYSAGSPTWDSAGVSDRRQSGERGRKPQGVGKEDAQ